VTLAVCLYAPDGLLQPDHGGSFHRIFDRVHIIRAWFSLL
jgi:hypothetical protein